MPEEAKSRPTRLSEADATKSTTHSRPDPKTDPPTELLTSQTSGSDQSSGSDSSAGSSSDSD